VTSLFKVPDEETRQMMRLFCSGLKAGKGKLAALHDAQFGGDPRAPPPAWSGPPVLLGELCAGR
jgi:hypothetical protein